MEGIAISVQPNFLFLLSDQHRFDWLDTTPGIGVRTPHLHALGARGIRFTRALCPSPLCAPSRACLASGREYARCGVPGNRVNYPSGQTTYYRMLRDEAGYLVLGVGKFDLHKASPTWGVDGHNGLEEWGFVGGMDNAGKRDAVSSGAVVPRDPYMAYLHSRGLAAVHVADFRARNGYGATHPTPLPDEAYCDNWIASNGLSLLRDLPTNRPWHLIVQFAGPHEPMDVTQTMAEWYATSAFPLPHLTLEQATALAKDGLGPSELVQIRRNYSAMVQNIDHWVGAFLDTVRQRGELERTVIVYSSDHGEMLGDRGLWAKSQPWQPAIGIPLVVAGPGIPAGVVSKAPVSLIDLAGTFLDYAGLPLPPDMDSVSLRPLLEGYVNSVRPIARSGLHQFRVLFDGRYKLVRGMETNPLLFDLDSDPWEEHDIADQRPEVVLHLDGLDARTSRNP